MKQKTEDILLTLLVKIISQLKKNFKFKKFLSANVKIITVNNQTLNINLWNFNKNFFLHQYKNYAENLNMKIDFNILEQLKNEELIKFIAISCQFSTTDKQMLLETYNLNDLANKLINLFDFYTHTKNNKNLFH